jgi:predicted phosphoadenosine phosphosulfate sulfurtransferase
MTNSYSGDALVASVSKGRIRKKKAVETDVFTLARERVREAYKLFDTVAVSFSGGKDSTAVLNLAIEAARDLGRGPVPAFFYDEEAISYETVDYVRRVAQSDDVDLSWYCLPIKHRNACTRKHPYWFPWAPEDEAKWVRPLPPEAITWDMVPGFPAEPSRRPTLPDSVGLLFDPRKYGRVGMLMGIRANESITRMRAILMSSQDTRPYIRPWEDGYAQGNLNKVYPIYDWNTVDVWTAPAKFGWDYNTSYDIMEAAGISHNEQRCAPPYGEEPLRGLWMYATCFPDIWDKMQHRVPGAATAARYSQTELYSYHGAPDKPKGMSWPDFIRSWIDKHPPEQRGGVAARVKRWINTHYKKTHEPLAVRAAHPLTGLSWTFVLNIAVRGDYKDRRQVNIRPEDWDKNRVRYDAEIARMRAEGEL